jgi:hypothetical protein
LEKARLFIESPSMFLDLSMGSLTSMGTTELPMAYREGCMDSFRMNRIFLDSKRLPLAKAVQTRISLTRSATGPPPLVIRMRRPGVELLMPHFRNFPGLNFPGSA